VTQPMNNAVVDDLIKWIKKQEFYLKGQQPNYAVGLTANGNLIISKVGGLTDRTGGMDDLQTEIQQTQWFSDNAPTVYLAKKYGGDGNSNHGEMCVLAAADALGEQLTYIKCTGDNCPACFAMLASAGVATGNAQATGTQAGWVHPRGRMALGTGLTSSWSDQIKELNAYNQLTAGEQKKFVHKHTQPGSVTPQGASTVLI